MSDLISRNEVLEEMEWLFNNYCNNARNFEQEETEAIRKAFDRLNEKICDIPTAYDVEKVVEQVEKIEDCYEDSLDNIKDIIKVGGVHE